MKTTDTIRSVLTIILLYIVWENSHWSVALSLTLIFIMIEVIRYTLNRTIDLLDKIILEKLTKHAPSQQVGRKRNV